MIEPDIIYNLSLLALLCILSNFLNDMLDYKRRDAQVMQGLLFGLLAVVAMMYPYEFTDGIIFDGRSVVIGLGTFFFGPVTGVISAVLAGAYRISLGGDGMIMGMLIILYAFVIGYLFFLMERNEPDRKLSMLRLALFGVLIHVMMVVFMFSLPNQYIQVVFQSMSNSVLIIYPAVTVLIGKILFDHRERSDSMRDLSASEEKFRLLVTSMDDLIFTMDRNLRYTSIFGDWMGIFGKTPEEFPGKSASEMPGEEVWQKQEEKFRKTLEGEVQSYEWHVTKNGKMFFFQTRLSPIRNDDGEVIGLVGIGRNITELKKTQQELSMALKDKNVLLAEIHHRVKNNMAIISSLLSLQSDHAREKETKRLLLETESRVRSMALVHEMVYERSNFSEINMRDLLSRLVRLLSESYWMDKRNIQAVVEADDITLDMHASIPCTLLVNELVTNATNHAFHENEQDGKIRVMFRRNEGKKELVVSDNGSGMKNLDKLNKPSSFGYTIIHGLVSQLKGKIRFENNGDGLRVTVRF